jgi:hypothetical protein
MKRIPGVELLRQLERRSMDPLRVTTTGAEGYESVIKAFVAQMFPAANLAYKESMLENVVASIVASGQFRYGPSPNPESLVAIRAGGASAPPVFLALLKYYRYVGIRDQRRLTQWPTGGNRESQFVSPVLPMM